MTKSKEGRPSPYNPEDHPRLARQLTGEGKTKREIAELLDIARSTLDEWRNKHPEFSVAFLLGKEDASDRVERALFDRATGYTIDSVKPMVVSQGGDMGSSVEMVDVKIHYPPDTAAAIHWLKNRRPTEWKDKQEVEHSGKLTMEQAIEATAGIINPPSQDHA